MRSISWRLTGWYTTVLLIILLTCGLVAIGVMRYLLVSSAAQEVNSAVAAVQQMTENDDANAESETNYEHVDLDDPELTDSTDYGVFWIQICSPDGHVLNSSRAIGSESMALGYVGPPKLTEAYGQEVVLSGTRLKSGDLLQVAKPFDKEMDFLQKLASVLLLVALGGLALAVVGGRIITRKALQPVENMTDTARKISVTDLSQRIPVNSPEDELSALAGTFNEMLDRVEEGFLRQQEFMAAASHDLRTPLTVIRNYAGLLTRWGKEDPAVAEESVAAIRKAVSTMEKLVNELLLLGRLQERPALSIAPVRLNELAAEIVQEANTISGDIAVKLGPAEGITVEADEDYLRRAVWALVDNAIKYNHPGGQVLLSVSRRNKGNTAVLSVADTGPGIVAEDIPRIFDRFYRADQARSHSKSFGLGLALAKEIIEAHGGRIEVESRSGYGSRFDLVLPLKSGR